MRFTLVLVVTLGLAATAHANLGRGLTPGLLTSEPSGLRAIAIEAEQLSFDLRPLADHNLPHVTATYHLDNRGEPVTAPLVFVTGIDRADDLQVTLDGSRLVSDAIEVPKVALAELPAAWRPPPTTPALDGGEPIAYETEAPLSFAFTIAIAPGRHELAVSYVAHPEHRRSRDGGTIVWQLGYVLGPARDWGSFGTLDVSIAVPPGWNAAVEPALARTQDTLGAHFTALPANTLAISVQAPAGTLHAVIDAVAPVLVVAVLLAGIVALVALGRVLGRRPGKIWPSAFGVAFVWAIAIGLAGSLYAFSSELALPAGQSAYYGYGHALGAIFAVFCGIVAIPIGIAIAAIAASRTRRAIKAAEPEPQLEA